MAKNTYSETIIAQGVRIEGEFTAQGDIIIEGEVRVAVPECDAVGECLPLVDVAHNAFFALRIELRDAVRLDIFLALRADLLFHLDFHRKSVRVPAAFAAHVVPLHHAKT